MKKQNYPNATKDIIKKLGKIRKKSKEIARSDSFQEGSGRKKNYGFCS
jgi:hypothetical protein